MTNRQQLAGTLLKAGTVLVFFVVMAVLGGPDDSFSDPSPGLVEQTAAALGLSG